MVCFDISPELLDMGGDSCSKEVLSSNPGGIGHIVSPFNEFIRSIHK